MLAGLPGAAEVAIVGMPDDTWGEVVCAVVVADGRARRPPWRPPGSGAPASSPPSNIRAR